MKKFFKHALLCFLLLGIVLSGFVFVPSFNKNDFTFADDISASAATPHTIFIRKPTYSVFYNDKIYFIDDADKLLKIYDTAAQMLDNNNSIDLSAYYFEKEFDVSFLGGKLYILTHEETKNSVIKIDLDTFKIDNEFTLETNRDYDSFFAQKVTFDATNYTFFTFCKTGENPYVALYNEVDKNIEKQFELTFAQTAISLDGELKNYSKIISYQKDTTLYIIFIYDYESAGSYTTKLAYYSFTSLVDLTKHEDNANSFTETPQSKSLSEINGLTNNDRTIDVNIAKISDVDYLVVSYKKPDNNEVLHLYNLDFGNSSTIEKKGDFSCQNSKYSLFNNENFVTTDEENQKIFRNEIKFEGGRLNLSIKGDIVNPNYLITYLDETIDANKDDFVYKTTKTTTQIYQKPWGTNPIIDIPQGTDVIKIGYAKLNNAAKTLISDYDYCLFTVNNKNYSGFIKTSELNEKAAVTQSSYSNRVTVWPGTRLYALPSVVEGYIGETEEGNIYTLSPNSSVEISENDEIQVVDMICGYTSNGEKLVKICVNGQKYGFIEAKCIHNPADVKEFVITNATIKQDGTVVYKDKNSDAETFSFKLNAGKNVRINGKRDTKTGWTSITFNDEYGNEFSGYIQTDYIKADAWSTLQILGCILIAINIGLLILILVYKKKHLGSHGQKIETDDEIVK